MKKSQCELEDDFINLDSKKTPVNESSLNIKSSKVPELDYTKVKEYWNNVTSTVLSPYMMEGFGFPIRAGDTRFLEECKIVSKLTGSIKSSSSVLDLGSGLGNWTKYFSNHYKEVISVESSILLYKTLQNRFSKNSKVKTIYADVLSFKSNKKYGIIFLGGLLMYLNEKDVVILLKNIASWLDSEGIIICRETTLRQGIATKKNKYQVVYRSVNRYKSIFNKINLILVTEKHNKAYIRVQMSCEVMKKWKKTIPERYWNLPVMGFIAYWIFRMGSPKNIKFWSSTMNKFGIEFPKLLNHFFVLKPHRRQEIR